MKNILFINSGFNIGGIETFIVRAARQLSSNVRFTLLVMSDSVNDDLIEEFRKYGDVIFLKDILHYNMSKYAIVRTVLPIRKKLVKSLFGKVEIIHASCSFSVVLMRRISQILNNNVKESLGVYHSREFLWGNKNGKMRNTQISIFKELSNKNVLFMNEYTAGVYSLEYKNEYKIALPIGVDVEKYSDCHPSFYSRRIISIGRLVDFKTYNKHMINSLHSFQQNSDRDFIFEIYGDGGEMENLKILSDSKNVNVIFHGKLDYASMPSVLDNAFLFVGCGTAVLEAAAAGVPSLVGIESIQEPVSHGFLTQTDGLSFHEQGLSLPKFSYIEVLNRLCSLSNEQYIELSKQHRNRSKDFSLQNMEKVLIHYYDELESTIGKKRRVGLLYTFGTLYWLLKNKLKLNHERNTMYDF